MSGLDSNTKLLIHANRGVAVGEYAHYKLNDNAANTTVTDSGSGANNGTASANTSGLTTTGKINAAFDFNGSSNYVNIDTFRTAVAADTKGTIAMWLRADTQSGGTSFSVSATSGTGTLFYVADNGANKFYVQYYNNGTADWEWSSAANAYPLSTWVHFVIVQDGVSPKFYVNGVLDTTSLTVSTNPSRWMSSLVNDNAATLGAYRYAGSTSGYFDGKIDDFRYYQNIALGQEAITAIYNAGTGTENSLIVDASASAHPITAYGNTYIAPAVPDQTSAKLASGGGNALFNGTSSYLSLADSNDWFFDDGTAQPFTIEFWVYFNGTNGGGDVLWQTSGAGGTLINQNVSVSPTTVSIFTYDNNKSPGGYQFQVYNSSLTMTPNAWHHIAIVRVDGSNSSAGWRIFTDGVSQSLSLTGSWAKFTSNSSGTFYIGYRSDIPLYFNGYLDELRISKGIARYTANFTPSTRFTADSYTKLLLHFDSNVTTDSETTPKTVTNNNVVWNAGSKWNSGALSFDGTGDYLTVPDSADFSLGSSIFTVDFQANWTVVGTADIIGQWGASDRSWYLQYYSGGLYLTYSLDGTASVTSNAFPFTPVAGVWYHIAVLRDSNNHIGVYVDGLQKGFIGDSITFYNSSRVLNVGFAAAGYYMNGNIDELRIQASNYFLAAPNSYPAAPLLIYGDSLEKSYAKFNGTTAYLTAPDSDDWTFGTGNFTIDCWVKLVTASGADIIAMQYQDDNNRWNLWLSDGVLQFTAVNSSVYQASISGSTTLLTGVWYHITVVRSGDDAKMFINGVAETITGGFLNSKNLSDVTSVLYIGRWGAGTPAWFDGLIDELRISKGTARWTSTFTPPTGRYTADANTQLLLHFDQSIITDNGNTGHTVTNNNVTQEIDNAGYGDQAVPSGTAGVRPGSTLFNTDTSLYFDGNSDYLTVTDTSGTDYDIVASATDSWTIDLWAKHSGYAGTQTYLSQYSAGTYWRVIHDSGSGFKMQNNGGSIDTGSNTPITNTNWHHFVIVKSGTLYGAYVDGVQVGFQSTSYTNTITASLTIGVMNSANYFDGYMEQVQITKGNKFGVVPATLLLQFDGTDGATSNTANTGQVVTFAGNAQLDTAQKQFGASSLLLDGTSDYVTVPDSDLWNLDTMDYTVECWIRFNGLPPSGEITYVMSQYVDSTHYAGVFVQESGGAYWMGYRVRNGSDQGFASRDIPSLSTGVWYHMAWVRDYANSEMKYYVNGTNISPSVTNFYPQSYGNFAAPLAIGARTDNPVGINGWIDDFRLYRGLKKYSGNFTVQTSPADITVPTAVLTQDTITVPTEEYDAPALGRSQAILIA